MQGPRFLRLGAETEDIPTLEYDLVVVTQSCDLENQKVALVACCPIFPIAEFESVNTDFQKRGPWEEVRKGRVEGLHLLGSQTDPANNRMAAVVDFREIYSLPFAYLTDRAAAWNALAIVAAFSGTFLAILRTVLHARRPARVHSAIQITQQR